MGEPVAVMGLTFVAVSLMVLAGYSAWRDEARRKLVWARRRMGENDEDRARGDGSAHAVLFKKLGGQGGNPFAEHPDESLSLSDRMELYLSQSGVVTTPLRLLVEGAVAGLIAGSLMWLLSGSVLIAGPPALMGASLPVLRVVIKRQRRMDKLRSQLADAFGMIARVMRSGQTAKQAMLVISEEFDQPVAGEFAYCYQQQNMGLPPEAALRDLARRTGLLEVRMFVVASIVHWQVGGNLAELLEKLSAVIRERFRIRGVIQTLTAEGRFQAIVLLALPFAIFGLLVMLNRQYAVVLLDYPYLIAGAFLSELIGALWIRKIINFDF